MSFLPNDEKAEPVRVIPLADAPLAPAQPHSAVPAAPKPRPAPEPLNTLKFNPLIIEALSKVYDPEIPVNIYELGLIYDITVDADAAVEIRMTLTAPGCPAAQSLPLEVERRLREIPGVSDVRVEIVWDPPWDRDKMSDAAKLQLGMF